MGLQDEYAAIAEGMALGTLKPAPVDKAPDTWIMARYSNGPSGSGFGEVYDSRIASSCAFSMGKCSRNEAKKIFHSKELAKADAGQVSPGPQAYEIRSCMGASGYQLYLSTLGRPPNTVFGTDQRNSAELRELKSMGIDVDRELATLHFR